MAATTSKILQIGKETTWGTAVVATAKLMELTDAQLERVTELIQPEDLGRFSDGPAIVVGQEHGEGQITIAATYEDLEFLLAGTFGEDGSRGAGPVYTGDYVAPVATAAAPRKMTLEWGSADGSYKLSGCIFPKLNIKGEAGGLWEASVDVQGKIISTVTLASLSDRTVELIRVPDTTFAVDAAGGTIGATVIPTMIGFEIDVETNRHLKFYAGSISPTATGEGRWKCTLKTTVEWDSVSKAWYDAALAGVIVQKLIRIKALSGTKIAQIDFAGTINPGSLFGDRDGNQTLDIEWIGYYNSTLANVLKMSSSNAVSVLV